MLVSLCLLLPLLVLFHDTSFPQASWDSLFNCNSSSMEFSAGESLRPAIKVIPFARRGYVSGLSVTSSGPH